MRDRCFIIGHGPSLRTHLDRGHFDQMKDEDCFGVNKCHLLYEETTWRPTYYVFYDRSNDTSYKTDLYIHEKEGYPMYIRSDIWKSDHPQLILSHHCGHHDVRHNATDSWHLEDFDNFDKHADGVVRQGPAICKQGGSIPASIQLAAWMGYPKIYLIGCDLGYKPNSTTNHWHPEYHVANAIGVARARLQEENLVYNHKIALKECTARGIEIYNAGIGGLLEVYPRVDIEDVL